MTDRLKKSKIELDLFLINCWSLALLLIIFSGNFGVFRPILAFPFVALFTGYTLLKVLVPKNEDMPFVERFCLGFGMSLITIPLIVLLLLIASFKINQYSISSSMYVFIVAMTIIRYKINIKLNNKIVYNISLRNLTVTLSIILIAIIGLYIRFHPQYDYSNYVGGWTAPLSVYPPYYTVQTGNLLESQTIAVSAYSSSIYNSLHQKAHILYLVTFFLTSGTTSIEQILVMNKFIPWFGAFLFPITVVLLTYKINNVLRTGINTYYYAFIFLIANFSSFRLLFHTRDLCNSLILGYTIFLLIIYSLINNNYSKKNRYLNKVLLIIFSFFLVLYYHTVAIAFTIIISTVAIIQRIRKEEIIPLQFITTYGIFFVSYNMYLAYTSFKSYVQTAVNILTEHSSETVEIGREVISIQSISHIVAYLNALLICILLAYHFYNVLKKDIESNYVSKLIEYLCIGIIPIAILFFGWRGLKGLTRVEDYFTIPLLLIISLNVASLTKKKKKSIVIFLSLCIVLTSIIPYSLSLIDPAYLTHSEEAAMKWYPMHDSNDKYVFSDFNIGTSPILLNYFSFVGITGHEESVNTNLESIYYESNASKARDILQTEYNANYILLDEKMKNDGVFALQDVYNPIPYEGYEKYNKSTFFNKIYNNNKAEYYLIN